MNRGVPKARAGPLRAARTPQGPQALSASGRLLLPGSAHCPRLGSRAVPTLQVPSRDLESEAYWERTIVNFCVCVCLCVCKFVLLN